MSEPMRTSTGAIRPPALRPGHRVALVSLSAGLAHDHPHVIASARRVLAERCGWELVVAPNALRSAEALYRDPRARADDLHWALESDDVHAVLTAIGGDESVRVAPHVDLELITSRPKPFIGFSDSTTTHALFARAGVVSFYGPAAMAGVADAEAHPGAIAALRRALEGGAAPFEVEPMAGWSDDPIRWERDDYADAVRRPRPLTRAQGHVALQGGSAGAGHLVGGCAEVLEMLKGTPYAYPDRLWDGAVLLYETSEMAPDPAFVEFWLRNYATQGVLQRLAGMVLARPRGYGEVARRRLFDAVRRVLAEADRADLPVLADVDVGHTIPMHTLPLLCRVRVDPTARTLTVEEDGVG